MVQNKLAVIAGKGNTGFKDGESSGLFKPILFSVYKNNSVLFADINNHVIKEISET